MKRCIWVCAMSYRVLTECRENKLLAFGAEVRFRTENIVILSREPKTGRGGGGGGGAGVLEEVEVENGRFSGADLSVTFAAVSEVGNVKEAGIL